MKKKWLKVLLGTMIFTGVFAAPAFSEEAMPEVLYEEAAEDLDVDMEAEAYVEEDADISLEEDASIAEAFAEEEQILESAAEVELADAYIATEAIGYYNVQDFGAVPDDGKDDRTAINKALDKARTSQTPITVYVPAGNYHISGYLSIYSNTTLVLDEDATILATYTGNSMLRGKHTNASGNKCEEEQSSCTHGGHTQTQHVTISGGTWDRGTNYAGTNTIITIKHGNDITIEDTTLLNGTEHFVNISGSANVTIRNTTFKDQHLRSDEDSSYWGKYGLGDPLRGQTMEIIHLDCIKSAATEGEGPYPHDGTGCENVIIDGCHFENVYSAAGNHHDDRKSKANNFTVKNSTFKKVRYYCIWASSFDHVTVTGNTFTDCGSIVRVHKTVDALVSDNKITVADTEKRISVYVIDSTNVDVLGNTISRKTDESAIKFEGSTGTISDNVCTVGADLAIAVTKSSFVSEMNNNQINGGKNSLRIADSTVTGTNNSVTGAAGNGMYITDSTVTLDGGTVVSSNGYGIHTENGTVTIRNMNISSCESGGILVGSASSCTLSGNVISDVRDYGIGVKKCTKAAVTGNKITNTGGYGIYAVGTSASKKEALTLKDNTIATKSTTSYDLRLGDYVTCTSEKDTFGGKGKGKVSCSGNSTIKYIQEVVPGTKTTSISVPKKSVTLKVKKKYTIKPTVKPATSKEKVTYTSSKKAVATVSTKGVITAKKAGKATITVKSGSKSVKITVTVKK